MPTYDDYTVGWICALPIELAAAELLMDNIHEEKRNISIDDTNDYILGTAGGHHVVVTTLAHDSNSVRENATKQMMSTFPHIGFILLVGVGGGVLDGKHNIQPGDVVVGSGLVQYTLNDPGAEAGVSANVHARKSLFRLECEFEGKYIYETINSILRKSSVLQHILNQPKGIGYEKVDDGPAYNNRLQNIKIPTVHHGLIASINSLNKSKPFRNELSNDNDILCHETRPEWLPDSVPCAIIRGIHDYSDSDENENQKRHAAMTAAAHAKNILCQHLLPQALGSMPESKKISDIKFEMADLRQLRLERIQNPRRFFRVGRVFAMVWTEPCMDRQKRHFNRKGSLKNQAFSEIRRFIVIHQTYRASLCIPIQTYGGQGVLKHHIKMKDHARIYRFEDEPPVSGGLPLREPVGIVMEATEDVPRLHPESIANFGKVYTVEYGAEVMNIGYVDKSQTCRLELNWTTPKSAEAHLPGADYMEGKIPSHHTEVQFMGHLKQEDVIPDLMGDVLPEKRTGEPELIEVGDDKQVTMAPTVSGYLKIDPVIDNANTPTREPPAKRRPTNWACPFFRLDAARYLECGMQKSTKFSDILQHLKLRHTESRKAYCHTCFATFEKPAALKAHISSCRTGIPCEFFFKDEFEKLRQDLTLSVQELKKRHTNKIPDDATSAEVKWRYIWHTYFSHDDPSSTFVGDLLSEIADIFHHKNKDVLSEAINYGDLKLENVQEAAYRPASSPHIYWIHQSRDRNDLCKDVNEHSPAHSEDILSRPSDINNGRESSENHNLNRRT